MIHAYINSPRQILTPVGDFIGPSVGVSVRPSVTFLLTAVYQLRVRVKHRRCYCHYDCLIWQKKRQTEFGCFV